MNKMRDSMLFLAISCAFSSFGFCEDLVHLTVNYAPVENGKTLKMGFTEISRQGNESMVAVSFDSGGSVSSSMFVLNGFCAIAKSRNMRFFKTASEPEGSSPLQQYSAQFSRRRSDLEGEQESDDNSPRDGDEDADDGIFSIEDCKVLGFFE